MGYNKRRNQESKDEAMFGYVRPHRGELLVREYQQYKAVYCQLCRQLGKDYGVLARLTLSYDCTFYAMLALGTQGDRVSRRRGRCVVNPLKACDFLEGEGESYHKAAALSVLLTRQKLKDDLEDEGFWKKLGCRLLLLLGADRQGKKAARRYPALAKLAEDTTAAQRQAEESQGGLDQCAEPTARLLSGVFRELGGCDPGQRLALERFGYFLGRWVYLMDAADDLERDRKEGSFNPFVRRLGLEGEKELTQEQREQADLFCNQALNATMAQMLPPFHLVELAQFGPILENVIEKGLPQVQREILFLHVRQLTRRERRELGMRL